MATPYSDTNSDDLSTALFNNLTSEVNIDLPNLDLGDTMYNLGDTSNNPLYKEVERLNIDELTTREPCGDGAFDALMEAYSKHLKLEFDKNRITGTEYANAYVQLASQAMNQSVQFLLGKDQAYWNSLLVRAQARAGEIQAIIALVELEKLKAEYSISRVIVEKNKAEYALTKMGLALEDARYDLTKTQDHIEEYRLSHILPIELLTMQENMEMLISQRNTVERERDKLDYEISTLLPDQHALTTAQISFQEKQADKIDADISAIQFNIQQMLPAQLIQLAAETEQIESVTAKHGYELSVLMPDQHDLTVQNIAKSTKEVEMLTYDMQFIKPVELQNLQAQTDINVAQKGKLEYELATLMPDQHSINLKQLELSDNEILKTAKDIEVINFNLSDMLPAELNKISADVSQINMQTTKISADKDNIIYQTNFTLPSQRENIIADTAVKQYQSSSVMPSQVANTESDTLIKEYTRMQLLPVQRTLTQEQLEAKRAETLNTRTDGIAVTGTVGKQKELYTQQIESYKRDAETKVAKMMIDTWITQKGIDEGLVAPTQLQNPSINEVINKLKNNNELT